MVFTYSFENQNVNQTITYCWYSLYEGRLRDGRTNDRAACIFAISDLKMEGKTADANALSWAEVQEICGEMEKLYRKDAQKDAHRLRALTHKRKQIANTVEGKQSESKKQLQRTFVFLISPNNLLALTD